MRSGSVCVATGDRERAEIDCCELPVAAHSPHFVSWW